MDAINLKNYFFYLTCCVIILAGAKIASEIIVILFLAIFISSIFSAFILFLKKRGIPAVLSYVFAISSFILGTLLLSYIINLSVKDFLSNLPQYEENLKNLVILSLNHLEELGYNIDKNQILEALNISSFFGFTTKIIGSIGTFLSKFLLLIIGISFILAEAKSFESKLKIIFKNNQEKLHHFKLFSHNIQKYFIVKTATSFLTGAIITAVLITFDIDYPILWGVIAMLFNFIPVIGSIVAAIPALLLSLFTGDLQTTAWLTALYMVVNISISNIIEPKLMGKELGLSPLVIFFSLILWGWILGIVGMFLAVPITMTLKIAFDSNAQTKWIAIMMSDLSTKKKINKIEP